MNYGYFDDVNREYVINNPRTPVKWINYVGSLDFGGFVDHTGGSLLCQGDPALNRITKYIPQLPSSDFKGEGAYIRIREKEGYTIFSPYWLPTLNAFDRFECRVGLQYTTWITEILGIRTTVTAFVPPASRVFVRDYRIENLREESVELDLVPVVEYTHPNALMQLSNADWAPQTMQCKQYSDEAGIKTLVQYCFPKKKTHVNFFSCDLPASSFETDRKVFLGDNEYGSWKNPLSLQKQELSNGESQRGDNICALMVPLGLLQSGEEKRVITVLGQSAGMDSVADDVPRWRSTVRVDKAFEDLALSWDKMLAVLQVETPDAHMNTMLNIHNPRQCFITRNWSRYLSLYQLGFGARGIGFRDSSQDVMGAIPLDPSGSRALLEKLLHVQRCNGSAMHQFNPVTMVANEGDSREMEDRPNYYGDDQLWIVQAVVKYLKETGELSFLEKQIPFYEKNAEGEPLETGTVLEHLERAVDFTEKDLGSHGIPLLGFADWNDTVNLPTGAESFLVAHLYATALLDLRDLYMELDWAEKVAECTARHRKMKESFESCSWDGEWYLRYLDEKGEALGSHKNAHGQIFSNGQSWAVISALGTGERAAQAMESVFQKLNTKNGVKLSAPGFVEFDERVGGVSTVPPGAKENGGIFCHSNPWLMIAETKLGNGDRAFQYYRQINPVTRNDRIEEFECAPYNYPQNILGDEHPRSGMARNSWLSGTSSWAYQAATQYMLGIRPEFSGLCIDPCIPKSWKSFRVTRRFRNAVYRIEVKNPHCISRGISSLHVDGKKVEGNVLPLYAEGVHEVVAMIGERHI